ncbi:MAG TPA: hypothetical protein ENI23_14645 [bacterium]|nr:hypothetical protein [bacterium]
MIFDLIFTLVGMLMGITIIFWIPHFILKNIPKKDSRYKDLIKCLEGANETIKRIWSYLFYIVMILVYLFISAFIGISSEPLIYRLNTPLGEEYALWASYAIAALIFFILSDGIMLKLKKKIGRKKCNRD